MYGSLKNGTGKKRNHRIKDVSFSRTSLLPNNAKLLRERAVSVYIYVCIFFLWLITDIHKQTHAYVHIYLSAGRSVQSCEDFWEQESREFSKSISGSLLFDVILPLK